MNSVHEDIDMGNGTNVCYVVICGAVDRCRWI